jgi:hypothetical protein
VVHLSSRYLNAADVGAMATYLLGDKPPAPQPLKPANADAGAMATPAALSVCAVPRTRRRRQASRRGGDAWQFDGA